MDKEDVLKILTPDDYRNLAVRLLGHQRYILELEEKIKNHNKKFWLFRVGKI